MAAKSIPDGFSGVTPMLAIKGAANAIEFYKKAFGAVELFRLTAPDGTIAHAEFKIGSAVVMLAEENPQYNTSPATLGGTSVLLSLYVPDVDAFAARAVAAGAKLVFPINNQFYGDRSGRIADPFGYLWMVATHIEDVSPEEMQKRFAKMCGG